MLSVQVIEDSQEDEHDPVTECLNHPVRIFVCVPFSSRSRDSYMYVSSQGVSGWAKLCCTFSHIILLPPFSVLTVPPEREYARLLSECVSVYVGVCAWHAVSLHFLFQVI